MNTNLLRSAALVTALWCSFHLTAVAETFRVVTYNVENYLDTPTETRREAKSADAKAKIREGLRALKPDVVAFQEMARLAR